MNEFQSDPVLTLDREGQVSGASPVACELLGKPEEDILGHAFLDFVHTGDRKAAIDALETWRDSALWNAPGLKMSTRSGWYWAALENGGNLRSDRIHLAARNSNKHGRAEEAADLERNLTLAVAGQSSLAESLPIFLDLSLLLLDMDCGGIYLLDRLSGDLVLKAQTGLSEEFIAQVERIEKSTERFRLVMKGKAVYEDFLQTPSRGETAVVQEGLRSFASVPILYDGSVIACINVASHAVDTIPVLRRSRIEGLSGHLGNMIARFLVQDDLLESRQQLQSLFDSLMDFVFVLGEKGNILEVNQVVLERLGYQREELLGLSVLDLHPPEQRAEAGRIVQNMLDGVEDTCPLDILCRDGSRIPVETRVAPGRWGSSDVLIGISRDITERKTADLKLQEKLDEIEGFFSVSLDLLSITDLQGHFLRVNQAWEDTLGFSIVELENQLLLEFVHPDDLSSAVDMIADLAGGERVMNLVNRFRTNDGDWRYLEWRARAQGELVYAAAQDITHRRLAEEARDEQTRLLAYRNAFEEILTSVSTLFINLPASEIDHEINQTLEQVGRFELVDRCYVFLINHGTTTMTNTHEWCSAGVEPSIELLQDLPVSIFPWWMGKLERLEDVHIPLVSGLPPEAQAEREILEEQDIKSVLVVPMHVDNKLIGFIGFDSVARPRTWARESIRLIRMVAEIISNALLRKQIEHDLRTSEERNRALLSAIPDIIFRISSGGMLLDFKASSPELLLVPPETVIGASLDSVLGEKVADQAMTSINQALETGEVQNLEYSLQIGDALHVFEARFRKSGLDEVIAIVRDISDRARLEQMKSDFIHRASHELRTPLSTMVIMAELIDEDIDEATRAECWGVLKGEMDRERQLIERLLTAGRIESGRVHYQFQSIDLEEIAGRALISLAPAAKEKNITVTMDSGLKTAGKAVMVNADESAMMQVMVNLVSNAIRFTPNGGEVTVSLQPEDGGAFLSVRDNGMGIPAEDLPMLFSRFFRASNAIKEEIQGTGIGLFIVQSVVDDHGGTIKVHSELGKGSQFDVWLPADPA